MEVETVVTFMTKTKSFFYAFSALNPVQDFNLFYMTATQLQNILSAMGLISIEYCLDGCCGCTIMH